MYRHYKHNEYRKRQLDDMLHGVQRNHQIGGESFPSRHDYLEHLGIKLSEYGIEELDAATVVAVQRDWHMRGQNGCVFAMRASRQLDERQWTHAVCTTLPEAETMRVAIEAAVQDPLNELLSMLFPNVNTLDEVRSLINLAAASGCTSKREAIDQTEIIRLRWSIGNVESWVIGFAPLDSIPATRRAPFTELIFRTKPKTRLIHPTLNNDSTQAHVADLDLGFRPEVVRELMEKSSTRTARLLGGDACRAGAHGAKAKTTYGFKGNQLDNVKEG